jgi:asparagine synthase (glutamine-hydrolysing)
MSTPDGRFHVTFNGEILNYRELREQVDYPFETDGDTEVVLAMFARFGVDGVKRLRGQFAFAIHDSKLDELWLVRDRLGILPLFYFKSSDVLAFGSEIKALLPVLPGGARVARQSLHGYLRQRAVPAPDTLVEGVVKLRPAEVICFEPTGGKIAARYWLPPGPADRWEGNVSTAVDMVERALKEAVTDALVSDEPGGAYLSGGVDSSLIVALASHQVSQPMHTFCASFGDPRLDESRHAESVAQLFGTRHHQIPMVPSTFLELWPRLSWHRDAPISEPSDIAVFKLAEAAREHVKVVLSGEGSDELFGGYPKYRFARLSFAAGLVPTALRQLALSMAEQTLPPASNRARIAMRALAADSPSDRARSWFSPFTGPEAARILGMPGHPEGHTLRGRDPVDLMCRVDIDSWLPDNLLERGDRMSMAASLELRPPFLDHRLVELALRLPSSFKVRSGETKWIVKQVADRHLPSTITRRRKVGFKVPLDAWLRTELRDVTRDLLLSEESQLSGVVDRQEVQRLLTLHDTGRRNEEIRIWTLLSLEQWLRTLPSMTSGECAGSQG